MPRPRDPGDWLTAPAANLPALRAQILRAATVERLPGSTLELDQILALRPRHEPVPMPKFTLPSARRRFIMLSSACIARSAMELALQIAQLDTLIEECPGLMALWFKPDTDALATINPVKLLARLRKQLEAMPKEQSDRTPSVIDKDEPVDVNGSDDDPDISM